VAEESIMDWVAIFDQYEVQTIVLDPKTDSSLIESLRACPQWAVDSEDGETVIFSRARSTSRSFGTSARLSIAYTKNAVY
jgi:hypothetical protein